MLSGTGLCDEVITRPGESYQLWCVVVCDLETSRIGAPYIYDISSVRVKGEGDPKNILTVVLLDIQFFCDVKLCQWVSNTQCVTGLWCLPSYTMNLQAFMKHTPNDTASHAGTNESSERDPFQSLCWVLWHKKH